MGSKIEYVESSQMYATNYIRNSKAIGVLWGVFSICYAIIVSVAFVTPEWIGGTETDYPARIGLWSSCYFGRTTTGQEDCEGRFDDFANYPHVAFKVAAILGAVAVLLALITLVAFLLFFFVRSTCVYRLCAWLQLLSGGCLIGVVTTYPLGWESLSVRRTCGPSANVYRLGECGVRWAYALGVVGSLDAVVLAVLAFILAARHVKLQAEPGSLYTTGYGGSMYKGDMNGGSGYFGENHSIAGSRKSLNLHPVLMMPARMSTMDADRFSETSGRTARSKMSSNPCSRPEYASSIHNFQL